MGLGNSSKHCSVVLGIVLHIWGLPTSAVFIAKQVSNYSWQSHCSQVNPWLKDACLWSLTTAPHCQKRSLKFDSRVAVTVWSELHVQLCPCCPPVGGEVQLCPCCVPSKMTSLKEDVRRSAMLCILTVPATMTSHDLMKFVASFYEVIEHMKIIRDSTPNQYMVLIKFSSQVRCFQL